MGAQSQGPPAGGVFFFPWNSPAAIQLFFPQHGAISSGGHGLGTCQPSGALLRGSTSSEAGAQAEQTAQAPLQSHLNLSIPTHRAASGSAAVRCCAR